MYSTYDRIILVSACTTLFSSILVAFTSNYTFVACVTIGLAFLLLLVLILDDVDDIAEEADPEKEEEQEEEQEEESEIELQPSMILEPEPTSQGLTFYIRDKEVEVRTKDGLQYRLSLLSGNELTNIANGKLKCGVYHEQECRAYLHFWRGEDADNHFFYPLNPWGVDIDVQILWVKDFQINE